MGSAEKTSATTITSTNNRLEATGSSQAERRHTVHLEDTVDWYDAHNQIVFEDHFAKNDDEESVFVRTYFLGSGNPWAADNDKHQVSFITRIIDGSRHHGTGSFTWRQAQQAHRKACQAILKSNCDIMPAL